MTSRYILFLIALTLFPASSFAQSRTTLKRRPPADIRQIDFRNYDYPRGDGTIRVQNGKWEGTYPGEYFSVDKIVYGDLTGDGEEEAVSVTSESGGGSGQFSGAIVFTLRNGRAVTLSSKDREGYGPYDGIKGGDRGSGGIYDVIIDNGSLLVEQYAPGDGPNAPPYQPAYIETTTYRWNGTLFIPNRNVPRRSFSAAPINLIGYVRKEHIADGCGCTYFIKGDATRPIYSDDLGASIWMNLDGQDVKLKLVSSASVPKGEARKGQRTTGRYVAPDIKVRIDTVIGKDYGEGRDHTGTIIVTKGSREQTVQIVGSCGC